MRNMVHSKAKARMVSILAVIISAIIIILLAPSIWGKSDLGLYRESVQELTYWHVESLDGKLIKLPNIVKVDANQTVTITAQIPVEERSKKSLCIRSTQQEVKVYFDGVLKPLDEVFLDKHMGKSQGSSWIIIDVPESGWSGLVSISFTSPYQSTSGMLSSILYGNRSDLLLEIIKDNSYNLFIVGLGYLSGIVCIIQCCLASKEKKQYERLLYLGIFDIVSSTWIFSEGKLIQFICKDQFIISNLPYFSLLILPIPFIYYMNCSYQPHQRLSFGFLAKLFYINYITVVVLQFCEVLDFFESLISIHILILGSSTIVIYSLMIEVKRYKNEDARQLLLPNVILMGSGIIQLFSFYINEIIRVSFFFETGLLIFMIMNGYFSIKTLNKFKQAQIEARIYEQLAFQDQLTGGKNRNAYEVDMEKQKDFMKENTWLVIFDANNLKRINDSFGHAYGDKMLKKMYHAITDCFSKHGTCYRIGGDEFALLYEESKPGECISLIEQFKNAMELQKGEPIAYDTAIGYAQYDKKLHDTFHKLEMEADYHMYQNKLKGKSRSRR